MLKFGFNDYEGFKEIFGLREGVDGLYRPNKILLAFLKSKEMREYPEAWGIKNMAQLFEFVDDKMKSRKNIIDARDKLTLENKRFGWVYIGESMSFISDMYHSDEQYGVCEDGDKKGFRYVLIETGRVYKMKFGKMFNHLIMLTDFGAKLPEQVRLWYIEEKCRAWETYVASKVPSDYEFHIGDGEELNKIYKKDLQAGEFHSCMNSSDGMHGDFYRFSLKNVSAAYLTSKLDGSIIARCVVFNECEDLETGEIVRLAERQYSSDCSDRLKRCLVKELIERNLIDGYKRVGADCRSPHNFLSADGKDWSRRDFKIRCSLEYGDVNAYMDSFKYYNKNKGECYNDEGYSYTDELTSTDDYWNANYDDFYNEYVGEDLEMVLYHGTEYSIAKSRIDNGDWVWVDSKDCYCWHGDVDTCPVCGKDFYSYNDGYYSDITEESYCCEYCRDDAERDYKERYWYYAEYDEEYFKDKDDIITVIGRDGDFTTIYCGTLERLMWNGRATENENGEIVLC